MSVKHIGTAAAALTLGLALVASAPAGAASLGTVAAEINAAINSSVIQVAKKNGGPGGPGIVRQRTSPGSPGIVRQRSFPGSPGIVRQRTGPGSPGIVRQRSFPGSPGIALRRSGPQLGRVASIRSGFFHPGRRLWVYPALGAGLIALTLAPGWYWGDYYDDCMRWIVPCQGCAPVLVDLCEPY